MIENTDQVSIWPFADLKKLSTEELLDRLEQVDNQANLLKWRLWWAIRQKFPSDKLFGQYIASLANTAHSNIVGSQQSINRWLHSGRFCELHKINDLNAIGILQSSIYDLAAPRNKDISTKIFNEIKRKNIPYLDVCRMIEQAKAVLTIDKVETVETQDFASLPQASSDTAKRLIWVEDGIAMEPVETQDFESLTDSVHQRRYSLLRELANIDASTLTDDQASAEILLFVEQYQRPFLKLIILFQICIKAIQEQSYFRK